MEDGGVDAVGNVMTGMKDDGGEEEEEEGLHPQDIDAYWLQRRISRANEEKDTPIDADKSQQLATEVFRILQARFAEFCISCNSLLCTWQSISDRLTCQSGVTQAEVLGL